MVQFVKCPAFSLLLYGGQRCAAVVRILVDRVIVVGALARAGRECRLGKLGKYYFDKDCTQPSADQRNDRM